MIDWTDVCRELQGFADRSGAYIVELEVRADGRVELRLGAVCIRADLLDGSAHTKPSEAFARLTKWQER